MDRDELVRAACCGDRQAREAIGEWLVVELRQLFASNQINQRLAHELCSDTIVDVWTNMSRPDSRLDSSSAAAFLESVHRFAWMCAKRRRTRTAREFDHAAKLEQQPSPDPTRSPTTKLAQRDAMEVVEQCVLQLKTPFRQPVHWKLIERRSLRQFAVTHDVPEPTAHSRYRRGKEQLRRLLEREGLSPSDCGL
jgi:DNA-directed RNA polymerase specialized sigma24 family protein